MRGKEEGYRNFLPLTPALSHNGGGEKEVEARNLSPPDASKNASLAPGTRSPP
jgi:hypothetical protein